MYPEDSPMTVGSSFSYYIFFLPSVSALFPNIGNTPENSHKS